MGETFFERYRDRIKSLLGFDDDTVDKLAFETKRRAGFSSVLRHPYLMHGLLAVITSIVYPILRLKKTALGANKEFLFVSCPDPVFRTKAIGRIAGSLQYAVVYLPNFHFFSALRYNKYFKKKGIEVCFPTVRLRYVWAARRSIRQLKKSLDTATFGIEELIAIGVIANYLIYDYVAKNILINTTNFKGKWILEHDKFYFTPMVVNLHQTGRTCTMLQHGCFVEIDMDFMPLYCDKVLCCSERERQTYISHGIPPENVMAFGAPLQSISEDDSLDVKGRKYYKLLLLLTFANEESLKPMQAVLKYVKANYESVLVRMRPRSKKNDMVLLQEELKGYEISENKNSLSEDISVCEKVISFSEDANFEVAKFHKPFVYVHSWTGENRDLRHDLPYATVDNYKDEIRKLMAEPFYSTFSEKEYKDVLGETEVEVLRQKFEKYIRS